MPPSNVPADQTPTAIVQPADPALASQPNDGSTELATASQPQINEGLANVIDAHKGDDASARLAQYKQVAAAVQDASAAEAAEAAKRVVEGGNPAMTSATPDSAAVTAQVATPADVPPAAPPAVGEIGTGQVAVPPASPEVQAPSAAGPAVPPQA